MSTQTVQRCPRCGNENSIDSYVCTFCGKRLKFERIEEFSIFKRIEAEWINPAPWYLKILWLFTKPNQAFWDINHKRKKAPGYYIILFNAILYGLIGLALSSHFTLLDPTLDFYFRFVVFLAFFLVGLILYFLFGFIMIWLFIKGANYAVGFSEKLEMRFGGEKQKESQKEAEMSPFSIYKGGLLQQQQAYKYKMLFCAFAPFILINLIEIVIILVGFPTVYITYGFDPNIFNPMFTSPIWAVFHVLDALTIAIWVPILITLAIRELSNSSTTRVLIFSLFIGILLAIFVYFFRPTLFG